MDSTRKAPSAFRRCPACGSRVAVDEATCDMCGHIFGETQAIPKAEIEAARQRELRRAGQAKPAGDAPSAPENSATDTGANAPIVGPAAAPAAAPVETRVSAQPRRRATGRSPTRPPVRPAASKPKTVYERPLSARIPWGVLSVVVLTVALLAGGSLMLRSFIGTPEPSTGLNAATPALELSPTSVAVLQTLETATATPTVPPTATAAPVFPTRTPLPPRSYVIVSGDTCGGIANKFDVDYADFIALNNLNDASCTRIQIGDTLLIPAPTPTPGPTETVSPDYTPPAAQPTAPLPADGLYAVKQGDTCSTIAEQFQTTVDAIIRLNPELNLNQQCLIRAGDKLRVMGASGTATPLATAFVLALPTARAGYAAPGVLAPVDNARIEQASVLLEWLAIGTLKNNEWYVVQIQPAGAITVPIFETRGTSLRLNADLLGAESERAFAWWVQVRQRVGERNGVPVYNDMSPASTVRRFVWRPPTPTAAPTP